MEKRFVFGRPSVLALAALACAAWWALALSLTGNLWLAMLLVVILAACSNRFAAIVLVGAMSGLLIGVTTTGDFDILLDPLQVILELLTALWPLIVLAAITAALIALAWQSRMQWYLLASAMAILPVVFVFGSTFDVKGRVSYLSMLPIAPTVMAWVGLGLFLVALAWHFRLGRPVRIGRMLGRRFRGAPCGTCAMEAVEKACLHEEARFHQRQYRLLLLERLILMVGLLGSVQSLVYYIWLLLTAKAIYIFWETWVLRGLTSLFLALLAATFIHAAMRVLRIKGQQRLAYARSLASVLIDDATERMRAKGLLTARCCSR